MISLHFLKTAELHDDSMLADIESILTEHGNRALGALSIKSEVNISVFFKAAWTIQDTGETGYTPTSEWIQITLDVTGAKHSIETVIRKRLPATIYHEMNHVRRWQTTGFGSGFDEELVSEGLACAFEMEQWQHDETPLFFASDEEINLFIDLVHSKRSEMKENYNYFEWFTRGSDVVPKWLGYKLGYYVVKKALEATPNKNVSDLTSLSASEVIAMSGVII